MGAVSTPPGPPPTDPVLVRREQVRRVAAAGQRLGFTIFALDVVAFFVALVVGFEGWLATVVTVGLIAGSVVLLPSILLAYTVRAADRDDRERGLR
jgi:hypothetical protein